MMASEVMRSAHPTGGVRSSGGEPRPCTGDGVPGSEPPLLRPPKRSWVTSRLVVRPSPIDGLGLFAAEEIKAGGLCLLLGGELLDDAGLDQVRRAEGRWSALAVGEGLHLVQSDDDPARLGNHSCDPTLWLTSATTVVARRGMVPGDEATVDYALATADEAWAMECRCGSSLCRGVVTGADWRLPSLRARYAGHFSPFIERRIRQLAS